MTTAQAETGSPSARRRDLPPEPQHAHPARYRRLRRVAVVAGGLLALALGLRLWWGREAARRLAAEVDAIRARGEPVLIDDFAPHEVPDPEDAIRAYQRAAGTVSLTATQQAFRDRFDEIVPLNASERRQVRAALDRNRPALQQARAARALNRYRAATFASPVYNTVLTSRSRPAELAGLLKWLALYDHDTGDDAGAIEALCDVPPLASALDREIPLLLQHEGAGEIGAIGVNTVFQIAHDVTIEGDTAPPGGRPAPRDTVTPASRAQVAALIAELLNDAPMREGMVRAIWGHRMMVIDGQPAALGELPWPLRWVVRPAAELDTIRLMRRDGQAAAAVVEPDYPSAGAKLPPDDPPVTATRRSTLEEMSRLPGTLFRGRTDLFVRSHYRYLAERRMAAVALAIRLYRADHAGRWPAALDELVPKYLPQVPADPLAAGGKPLRYLRDAPGWDIPPALAAAESNYVPPPGTGPFLAGPIVYSVGDDGSDDGGSRRLKPGLVRQRHTFSLDRAEWQDLVVPLAGNPEARDPTRPRD